MPIKNAANRCLVLTKVALGCAVLSVFSGCVTDGSSALSLEARQSLRLQSVQVEFPPSASIHLSQVEDDVHARGGDDAQVAQAERAQISKAITSEMMSIVGSRLSGGRPVVAKVAVTRFYVPEPVAAMLGGGSSEFSAGIDLIDAKTGETLASIPPGKLSSSVYRPGGVIGVAVQAAAASDPSELKTNEMARSFANEYAQWLLAS